MAYNIQYVYNDLFYRYKSLCPDTWPCWEGVCQWVWSCSLSNYLKLIRCSFCGCGQNIQTFGIRL